MRTWVAASLLLVAVLCALIALFHGLIIMVDGWGLVGFLVYLFLFPLVVLGLPLVSALSWNRWDLLVLTYGAFGLAALANWLSQEPEPSAALDMPPDVESPGEYASAPAQTLATTAAVTAPDFCGHCGAARRYETDRFCRGCGAALDGPSTDDAPFGQAPRYRQAPRARPVWLVAALSAATFGVYPVIWFGRTWSELKREVRDQQMRPMWHALAMLVPIYGWFRLHAHFRLMRDLLGTVHAARDVSPRTAVLCSIGATICQTVAWPISIALNAAVVGLACQ